MLLKEVLKLDKTNSSIKKIDFFIGLQTKYSYEHLKALAYKAEILHHLGKDNDALKLLYEVVPDFNSILLDGIIVVCDGIIDLCIELKRYDQVLKYIKIKESYLPISKSVLHIKDTIKYYLALKQYDDALNALEKFLREDISKDEVIEAKIELSKLYMELKEYDKYLGVIKDVESYFQSNLMLDELADIGLNKIIVQFEKGNYPKVVSDGNYYLKEEFIHKNHILVCATLMIKSYIYLADYKRASIVESDYYDMASEDYLNESLEFFYASLELYKKTNTIVSIKDYEAKIEKYEAIKKEHRKENKKSKKAKEEIVIPDVEIENKDFSNTDIDDDVKPQLNLMPDEPLIKSEINQKLNIEYKKINNIVISENYLKLEHVFDAINNTDITLEFREIFRQASIAIDKEYGIKEIYLLYFDRKYKGLYYKKERCYDKELTYEDLENTLNYQAYNYEQEMFLNKDYTDILKSIVTHEEYVDIPYGFAMPLFEDVNPIGSIAFFSDEEFINKEMAYESLKLIVKMINTRLLITLAQNELEYNNKKLFFINNNFDQGLKEEIEGYIHLNEKASSILETVSDIRVTDFYSKIDNTDLISYKALKNEIYSQMCMNSKIEYSYKCETKIKKIKETFYPMINNGEVSILSIIEDITEEANDKKDLINLAYQNPISKLDTPVKLTVDLNSLYKEKILSLAIVDIIDFDLYRTLYGYNFTNQLIYTVGKSFKDYYSNQFTINIYHLEVDRYAILFKDINDKRVVDSSLRKAFSYVHDELFKLNSRVDLLFNSGVYRLPKNNTIDDASKIIYYAYDALDDAKEIKTSINHICHFDSELHKAKFREKSLITHISEAIDHNKIGLTYKQIVNLENNNVFGYMIIPNLDNYDIDYNYMDFVIKRRGLIVNLEKYTISNAIKEQKMLYDVSKSYLLSFIKISKETILDNLYNFLKAQMQFYKIASNYICFYVDDASSSVVKKLRENGFKIASNNIYDVYNNYCDLFFLDSNKVMLDYIKEVKELCDNHKVICIIDNIDSKDDVIIVRENKIDLIYGQYFKKVTRMKAIIEKIKPQLYN